MRQFQIYFYVVNGEILVDCTAATPRQIQRDLEAFEEDLKRRNAEDWIRLFGSSFERGWDEFKTKNKNKEDE